MICPICGDEQHPEAIVAVCYGVEESLGPMEEPVVMCTTCHRRLHATPLLGRLQPVGLDLAWHAYELN